MKNTIYILILILLISGTLAIKSYYDASANFLKTFTSLKPEVQALIIERAFDSIQTDKAKRSKTPLPNTIQDGTGQWAPVALTAGGAR